MSLCGHAPEWPPKGRMDWNLASIKDLPVAGWVILLATAAFLGEYVVLRFRQQRFAGRAREAQRRLTWIATALRNHAAGNLQRLPASLDELKLPDSPGVAYRPAPRLNLDEKLILLHDREPTHKVLEFPVLRDGRGLVFCSGRLLVVSEEVFQKLIAADDALRERLGIAPEPGTDKSETSA
jgi:hypothetical protein